MIEEDLDLLDLTVDVADYNRKEARTAFSQPGIRYSQAESLIKSLMQDDKFRDLSLVERKRVTERILAEIKANVSRPSRREYTGRCGLFECGRIFEKVITYA